uniref:DNA-directed RNA polymerases I, II, and III subunit RPABC1 n=1 Tax=Ditylenchus dipsaci TaxID=166011 RepID=A0A915ER43_9BILA
MAAEDESEFYRLWRVRKTIMEMCHDRGYLVSPEEINCTLDGFKEHFAQKLPMRSDLQTIVSHSSDPTRELMIFFPEDPKIGLATLRSIYKELERASCMNCIVVLKTGLTPSAKSLVEMMKGKDYIVETFIETELMVNITQHELVPEHIVLSNDEKLELLAKYKLKESQLPRIQMQDPVSRYFGMKKGQVFKIIRASETAGRYITYRCVT